MKGVKDDDPYYDWCDQCGDTFISGYLVGTGETFEGHPVVEFFCGGCYRERKESQDD